MKKPGGAFPILTGDGLIRAFALFVYHTDPDTGTAPAL